MSSSRDHRREALIIGTATSAIIGVGLATFAAVYSYHKNVQSPTTNANRRRQAEIAFEEYEREHLHHLREQALLEQKNRHFSKPRPIPKPRLIPIPDLPIPDLPIPDLPIPDLPIPDLPNGKNILDIVVNKKMDHLFTTLFGESSTNFWESHTHKAVGGAHNFCLTSWTNEQTDNSNRRKMTYQFEETIAWCQYQLSVQQDQILASYSKPGVVQAINCVTQTQGHQSASCFRIKTHYRITPGENNNKCRLVVIGELEFIESSWLKRQITAEVWKSLEISCQIIERQVMCELEDDSTVDLDSPRIDTAEPFAPSAQDLDDPRIDTVETFAPPAQDIVPLIRTPSNRPAQRQIVPLIRTPSTNTEPRCLGFKINELLIFVTFSLLVLSLIVKWSDTDKPYSVVN